MTDPLNYIHIYTRFNNLEMGYLELNINEIFAIDVHKSAMTKGGKTALTIGILVPGSFALFYIILAIAIGNSVK